MLFKARYFVVESDQKTSLVCLFIMLIKLNDSIIRLECLLNAFPEVIAKQNSTRSSHSSCSSLHKANSPDNPDFTKHESIYFYLFSGNFILPTSTTPCFSQNKTKNIEYSYTGKIIVYSMPPPIPATPAGGEGEGSRERQKQRQRLNRETERPGEN